MSLVHDKSHDLRVLVNDNTDNGVYEKIAVFEGLEPTDIGRYSCLGTQTVMGPEGNFTTSSMDSLRIDIESRFS